jgi:hypothetical protein
MIYLIRPMPPTARHPYVRWATTRIDGYGGAISRFCDALRHAQTMSDPKVTRRQFLAGSWFGNRGGR